jgi:hypothetical protein
MVYELRHDHPLGDLWAMDAIGAKDWDLTVGVVRRLGDVVDAGRGELEEFDIRG